MVSGFREYPKLISLPFQSANGCFNTTLPIANGCSVATLPSAFICG